MSKAEPVDRDTDDEVLWEEAVAAARADASPGELRVFENLIRAAAMQF
jgi:hypothetical protein